MIYDDKKLSLAWRLLCLSILFPHAITSQTVEIVRDNYWVPHIIGETVRECAFGLAIAMCQDHPKVVVDNTLKIRGELARAYGTAFPGSDQKVRAFRLHQTASNSIQQVLPKVLAYLQGFAAGVNFYFTEHPEKVPPEVAAIDFFPVTAVDVFAQGYLKILTHEWARFQDEAGDLLGNSIMAVKSTHAADMSNSWTVAPARTKDGAGYLLCDPHLPFDGLTATWEAHLISRDGVLDFEGGFFLGTPSPIMGHNRHLAWVHTSNSVDFADAYVVSLDPNNPEHYLLNGQSKPFSVWSETIEIAGAEPRTIKFRASADHGVWVKKIDDSRALFAKLELYGQPPLTGQGLRMMASKSVAEFEAAMALHLYDKWNTTVQDDQGHLLYIYNGRTHRRSNPQAARSGVLDGSTSATLWGDLIPFQQLPRIENPASGYLQNCNDAPWYGTEAPGFGRQDVPTELYSGDHFGERGRRATELLKLGGDTLDAAYLQKVALDTRMTSWDSVRTVLQSALQESAADSFARQSEAEQLAQILFDWHGFATKDAPEMALLYAWRESVPRQISFFQPEDIDYAGRRALVTGLVDANDDLISQYGSLNVTWGEIHGMVRNGVWYPLSGGMGGNFPSARLGHAQLNASGRLTVRGGNVYLMLVRLKAGEPPTAWTMKPHGQSSDPGSAHYADLTGLYSADSLRQTYYEENDFRSHAESIERYDVTTDVNRRNHSPRGPENFSMSVWPNPGKSAPAIRIALPQPGEVRIELYNLLGQRIDLLNKGILPAGIHKVHWEISTEAAPGVYFFRLILNRRISKAQKYVIVK